MTKLTRNRVLRRETESLERGKKLIVELGPDALTIRPKGARRGYDVDWESIFTLGAKKEAERTRMEREANRRGQRRRRRK